MEYGFKEYKQVPIISGHLNVGGENPAGERIDVNSKYLTKAGRPWLPVMGEYHFARDNKENWYAELMKMKAGGIGIVATYLFWIYHEEEEGRISFDGDLDVGEFVREAKRAGLYVLLRLGPWEHGECRNGGFPDWILKKGFKVRENNEGYLAYCEKWYAAIFEQVKGQLYKDGGNIIGVQLDNELTDNAPHLKTLKDIAKKAGFDVPLYTVTGWNSKYGAQIPVDEVVPVFGAYPDAPWASGSDPLPLSNHYAFYTMRNDTAIGKDLIRDESTWQLPYEKYPFATCELGPGMMSTYHRRVLITAKDAYALSLVKLGCGNNLVGYYMYHGGTNKVGRLSTFNETRASGYPNDYPILNYDFQTCISEYGEIRDSYRRLNLLHLFINDLGSELAQTDHVPAERFVPENDLNGLRYCMRRRGDSGFIFVNNYQRGARLPEHKNVIFTVKTGYGDPHALKAAAGECGEDIVIAIDVPADTSFILPFNLTMSAREDKRICDSADVLTKGKACGTVLLRYSTAQLLCRSGNTYYFMCVNSEKAVYDFGKSGHFEVSAGPDSAFTVRCADSDEEIKIITLTEEEALRLRKVEGRVYFEDKADASEGNCAFELAECVPAFEIEGEALRQLQLSKAYHDAEYAIVWKKISAAGAEGFVELDKSAFDGEFDVAQIYADGQLVADCYYYGAAWRVPAGLIFGHESYLVYSKA